MAQLIEGRFEVPQLVLVKLVDGSIGIGKIIPDGFKDVVLISINQTDKGVGVALAPMFFPFDVSAVTIKSEYVIASVSIDPNKLSDLIKGYNEFLNPSSISIARADAINELNAIPTPDLNELLRSGRGGRSSKH